MMQFTSEKGTFSTESTGQGKEFVNVGEEIKNVQADIDSGRVTYDDGCLALCNILLTKIGDAIRLSPDTLVDPKAATAVLKPQK